MKIYEIRLETNVSGFEVKELDNLNHLNSNFIPDWQFHIEIESLPEVSTVEELFAYLTQEDVDYYVLSNEEVEYEERTRFYGE